MRTPSAFTADQTHGRHLELVLLATTDLHAHLRPFNYYTDSEGDHPGLSRIATLVERQRALHPNCLLFDNGDTLQGTPLGDVAVEAPTPGPHPMIAAMNALGYDAATVGNHDFNYGLAFLHQAVATADHPVVLANVTLADGTALLPRSVILDRAFRDADGQAAQLRIGVIGLAPPQITKWDASLLKGRVETSPIVATAKAEATPLRQAGADLVIALCHSGEGPSVDADDLENALLPLAASGAVDAIVAGHTHRHLPRDGIAFACPVVQPGFFGSHLGQITLTLRDSSEGWQVVGAHTMLHPATGPDAPASPALMRLSEQAHEATIAHARRQIGITEAPLETFFALAGDSPTLALVAEAGRAHAVRALKDHPLAQLPILSAAAPFKAGGRGGPGAYTDIPAGPLSLRNAADLYPFPNALHVLRASGADLRDWLERVASAFNRIDPGSNGQTLLDPGFSGYNFDVLFGLSYRFDLSAPARYSADGEQSIPGPGRVRALSHQGRPLSDDDAFLVVTNSYRAAGGGHFMAPPRCDTVLAETISVREVVTRHIIGSSPLRPKAQPTWGFEPMGRTEVLYETGPGAVTHTERMDALGLAPVGPADGGFFRFTLRL
ncbi:bifunctional 2',3'-cyclic-nucleotide 2'-phosphodiesterase/3'-nucleotidase [Nioella sp.]|uniref:bifunctional 2',3'-cyclic-nucleotide 2'-phosphodiesterase/3'-nucleotidase n=1 Tax=Nioella sp. TaxID=1912091 RepID=UPI003515C929